MVTLEMEQLTLLAKLETINLQLSRLLVILVFQVIIALQTLLVFNLWMHMHAQQELLVLLERVLTLELLALFIFTVLQDLNTQLHVLMDINKVLLAKVHVILVEQVAFAIKLLGPSQVIQVQLIQKQSQLALLTTLIVLET